MITSSQANKIPVETGSLETQLLLCLTRTEMNSQTAEAIENLLRQNINWAELIEIAKQHKVMPLVYQSLKDTCPNAVPKNILDNLQLFFKKNLRRNLLLTSELLKLVDLFKKHKIPVIAFKGPTLTALAYGNLALREIQDLDILVHESDFVKAEQLLISYGYWLRVRVPWEAHYQRNDLYSLDLHQDIVPKHLSCFSSSNYLWEHIEFISLSGINVLTLSLETSLIVLCLNGTKECWQNLNRICDVAELLRSHPNIDWERLIIKINKLRCKRLVLVGIFISSNFLDIPLNDTILRHIKADRVAQSIAENIKKRLFSQAISPIEEVERTIFHIRTREDWQDKVKSFIGLMKHSGWMNITKNDRDFIHLPNYFTFVYYLIRPLRISLKYSSILAQRFYVRDHS
ncbi:nucleotidyltransferase family protein [Myxosarcina sp. GI1]|uniref:nucleotidyltransferase domain-containing protein n=1 Tax=Myxosarcina sp. GI1 TaxID=1541065 RepID=UPI000907791D|nr:nucleotidyltransferase family protein [Myxosarcina sp. GI1]